MNLSSLTGDRIQCFSLKHDIFHANDGHKFEIIDRCGFIIVRTTDVNPAVVVPYSAIEAIYLKPLKQGETP